MSGALFYDCMLFIFFYLLTPEEYCWSGVDWLTQNEHLQSWTQRKGDDAASSVYEHLPLCDVKLIAGGHQVHSCWRGCQFLSRSLAHTWYVVEAIQCVLWYHYCEIVLVLHNSHDPSLYIRSCSDIGLFCWVLSAWYGNGKWQLPKNWRSMGIGDLAILLRLLPESKNGNRTYGPCHPIVLGAPAPVETIQERAPTAASTDNSTSKFKAGDQVKVQLEVEIFRQMQEGHGGWNDQMAEVRCWLGICHSTTFIIENMYGISCRGKRIYV